MTRAPDASVFLSRSWVAAWWRHFGRGSRLRGCHSKLHIVAITRGTELVALAPMLTVSVGLGPATFRVMVGIGQENADYGAVLVAAGDEEAMGMLLDHIESELGRGRTVLDLARIPESTWFHRALVERFTEPRYCLRASDPVDYPFLDLRTVDDPVAYVHRMSQDNDVERRTRRLAETGSVSFTFHRPDDAQHGFEEFLRLHDLRWAGRNPVGPFSSTVGRAFLADLSGSLEAAGLLRVSFMAVDGVPFAGRFGTEFGGAYQGMKSGWDPALAAYGPGHMLVARILGRLATDGVAQFDFMRGAGPHKTSWANGARRVSYWTLGRHDRLTEAEHRAMWLILRSRYRARSSPEAV